MIDEELKWKVIESVYLFKDPWLTVRQELVELPNRSQIPSYYVLEYPNWVNVIAITEDGDFVLIKQYRHGLSSVNYELCAGVCEKDDKSPLFSAQRELLEETGYGNGKWEKYMIISPNPSTHTNLTYCYLATGVEKIKEQELEETEFLSVHLFSKEEVRILLEQNKIVQALMVAPLWKYLYNQKFSSLTRK
jgi:ADP-ribose pyrophosphatase